MFYSEKNKSYNSVISLVSASNSFEMNVMGITKKTSFLENLLDIGGG